MTCENYGKKTHPKNYCQYCTPDLPKGAYPPLTIQDLKAIAEKEKKIEELQINEEVEKLMKLKELIGQTVVDISIEKIDGYEQLTHIKFENGRIITFKEYLDCYECSGGILEIIECKHENTELDAETDQPYCKDCGKYL